VYLEAYFNEDYIKDGLMFPRGSISQSIQIYVGKRVTIYTDIDKILSEYKLEFKYTTKKWLYPPTYATATKFNLTTYKFSAIVGEPSYEKIGNKFIKTINPYISFNFVMDLSPPERKDLAKIEKEDYNFIKDLENYSDKRAVFSRIHIKELDNIINKNKDPLIEEYSTYNYIRRVLFKEIWQLKYPPWTFEEAKELYKKYILSFVQSDSWLENLLKYIPHPTLLQLTYSVALFQTIELEKPYSPAFLYSLTLSTGDYRYIIAALRASVIAINESLRIGALDVKMGKRKLLDEMKKINLGEYALAASVAGAVVASVVRGALAGAIGGPKGALVGAVVGFFAGLIVGLAAYYAADTYIISPEYDYLYENAYSPQYLLNLVKIIELDLSLLNYEIYLWKQLKD
jgi:hypothetical protein